MCVTKHTLTCHKCRRRRRRRLAVIAKQSSKQQINNRSAVDELNLKLLENKMENSIKIFIFLCFVTSFVVVRIFYLICANLLFVFHILIHMSIIFIRWQMVISAHKIAET